MIDYKKSNLDNAKALRKEMTPWERKLYYLFLKNLKFKFYKQKLIGSYIVDFYCGSLKLAIELDGSQHFDDEHLKYDAERTNYLNSLGIKVLRYTNEDIDKRFNGVCEDIYKNLTTSPSLV